MVSLFRCNSLIHPSTTVSDCAELAKISVHGALRTLLPAHRQDPLRLQQASTLRMEAGASRRTVTQTVLFRQSWEEAGGGEGAAGRAFAPA